MKSFNSFCEDVVMERNINLICKMVDRGLIDPVEFMTKLVEDLTSTPEDESLFLEFDPLSMAAGAGGMAAWNNRDKIKDWFKNKFNVDPAKADMAQKMSQGNAQSGQPSQGKPGVNPMAQAMSSSMGNSFGGPTTAQPSTGGRQGQQSNGDASQQLYQQVSGAYEYAKLHHPKLAGKFPDILAQLKKDNSNQSAMNYFNNSTR